LLGFFGLAKLVSAYLLFGKIPLIDGLIICIMSRLGFFVGALLGHCAQGKT
jgi:hypothetical protein